MLRLAVANAARKWLDTYMKNCFTRRGGDSERRSDKPQKTVRRRVGVALKSLIPRSCDNCLRRPRNFAIAVECSAMQGYAKQRSYIFVYTYSPHFFAAPAEVRHRSVLSATEPD
jgi:hypothetical protein